MDWIQFFTLMITIIGSTLAFYRFMHSDMKETFQDVKETINKIDERINRMEVHHRADMQSMDAKWERLFERLLLKDNAKG